MNKIEQLIKILETIKEKKQIYIPYNLHDGIRCLSVGFGSYERIIKFLDELNRTELNESN